MTPAQRTRLRFGGLALSALLMLATAGCTASPPPLPSPSVTAAAPGIRDAESSLTSTQVFAGGLFVDPHNHASSATARLKSSRDADAAAIAKISSQPTAVWLGDQYSAAQLGPLLAGYVSSAKTAGRTLVFVTYAIPNRDCGGLSAGGLSASAYATWNRAIATALRGSNAVILVEPDSLAMLTEKKCAAEVGSRPAVIRSAVHDLVNAGLTVYLDAGNSHWVKTETMAGLLEAAGVADTRGFFTNVSNFYRVDQERAYAESLSALIGKKHFVVDVSRNGNGWKGTWCNPSGAALGQDPHVSAGTTSLDALLWVKHPGDSDGTCNGGPKAGVWWEQYALDLVRNGSGG
ncbi:glycoside hydrolase family 6 protein [Lacisediminihabitans sp. H27-G8]|uniref:glycoside hydrolase family 6 protein n=1 Tax=Lacisediminihabitans sp. H27-G8 TaxID=3111909 RepID=UPI0038FCAFCF